LISGSWSANDVAAAGNSAAFGPFSLMGISASQSGVLSIPGVQIIAWICSLQPKLPPETFRRSHLRRQRPYHNRGNRGGPMGTPSQALDYDTDMQTIRDYVQSVVETQAKLATSYTSALDNFQTTVLTASPADAKPDVLGAILKSGLKSVEKSAVSAVKDSTGADLGPLVDMLQAVSDEIDRAAKAATSYAVGAWIKRIRTSVSNSYTQGQTGEDGTR